MGMIRGVTAVLLVVACLTLVGCGNERAEATAIPIATNNSPPDIRGTITTWVFEEGEGSMLVEGETPDGGAMAAQILVDGRTQIARQSGEVVEAGEITQLSNGQTVEVRFDGPAAESFPLQATAREVIIID